MHRKMLTGVLCLIVGLPVVVAVANVTSWQGQDRANSNAAPANANKPAGTRKRRAGGSARVSKKTPAAPCDPNQQQPADLSGTYKGTVSYPEGGLSGDATLTITGNQFLLALGNAAQTGRITAVTTCSYTAATMMFGELKKPEPGRPAPAPLPVVSLRVVKKANGLSLTPVPGERRTFSFASNAGK